MLENTGNFITLERKRLQNTSILCISVCIFFLTFCSKQASKTIKGCRFMPLKTTSPFLQIHSYGKKNLKLCECQAKEIFRNSSLVQTTTARSRLINYVPAGLRRRDCRGRRTEKRGQAKWMTGRNRGEQQPSWRFRTQPEWGRLYFKAPDPQTRTGWGMGPRQTHLD